MPVGHFSKVRPEERVLFFDAFDGASDSRDWTMVNLTFARDEIGVHLCGLQETAGQRTPPASSDVGPMTGGHRLGSGGQEVAAGVTPHRRTPLSGYASTMSHAICSSFVAWPAVSPDPSWPSRTRG